MTNLVTAIKKNKPKERSVVLYLWRDIWRLAKYCEDEDGRFWSCNDFNGVEIIIVSDHDIWCELPPTPSIDGRLRVSSFNNKQMIHS